MNQTVALGVAVAMLLVSEASAETYVFNGDDTFADWNDANTWLVDGAVPNAPPWWDDDVRIDPGTTPALLRVSEDYSYIRDMTITGRPVELVGENNWLVLEGDMRVDGGATLLAGVDAETSLVIGEFSGLHGSLTVADATVTLERASLLVRRFDVGSGATVNLQAGANDASPGIYMNSSHVAAGGTLNIEAGRLDWGADTPGVLSVSGTVNVGPDGDLNPGSLYVNPGGIVYVRGKVSTDDALDIEGLLVVDGSTASFGIASWASEIRAGGELRVINGGRAGIHEEFAPVAGTLFVDESSAFEAYTLNVTGNGVADIRGELDAWQVNIRDNGFASIGAGAVEQLDVFVDGATLEVRDGLAIRSVMGGRGTVIVGDGEIATARSNDWDLTMGEVRFDLISAEPDGHDLVSQQPDGSPATLPPALWDVGLALDTSTLSAEFGDVFLLLDNTSDQPIFGTFVDAEEGGLISAGGFDFRASYLGGDGNDFTLTLVPEPTPSMVAAVALLVLLGRRRQ